MRKIKLSFSFLLLSHLSLALGAGPEDCPAAYIPYSPIDFNKIKEIGNLKNIVQKIGVCDEEHLFSQKISLENSPSHDSKHCSEVAMCDSNKSEQSLKELNNDATAELKSIIPKAVLLAIIDKEIQNEVASTTPPVCEEPVEEPACAKEIRNVLSEVSGSFVGYPNLITGPKSNDSLNDFFYKNFFSSGKEPVKTGVMGFIKKSCRKKIDFTKICSSRDERVIQISDCEKNSKSENCLLREQKALASLLNSKKSNHDFYIALEKQLCISTRLVQVPFVLRHKENTESESASYVAKKAASLGIPSESIKPTSGPEEAPVIVPGLHWSPLIDANGDSILLNDKGEQVNQYGRKIEQLIPIKPLGLKKIEPVAPVLTDLSKIILPIQLPLVDDTKNSIVKAEPEVKIEKTNSVVDTEVHGNNSKPSSTNKGDDLQIVPKNNQSFWNPDVPSQINRNSYSGQNSRNMNEDFKAAETAEITSSNNNNKDELAKIKSDLDSKKTKLEEINKDVKKLESQKYQATNDLEAIEKNKSIDELKKKVVDLEAENKINKARKYVPEVGETDNSTSQKGKTTASNTFASTTVSENHDSIKSEISRPANANSQPTGGYSESRGSAPAVAAVSGSQGINSAGNSPAITLNVSNPASGTVVGQNSNNVYMTSSEVQKYPFHLSEKASSVEINKMLKESSGVAIIFGDNEQIIPEVLNGIVQLDENGNVKYKKIKITVVKNESEKKSKIKRQISTSSDLKQEDQKQGKTIRYYEMKALIKKAI